MNQNLLQPFSSITFTQRLDSAACKGPHGSAPPHATHSSLPQRENRITRGYLLGKSKKTKKPLPTQRAADSIPSTLAGLPRNWETDQAVAFTCDSMRTAQSCALVISLVRISSLGVNTHQNTFLPWRGAWGSTGGQDPQASTARAPAVPTGSPGWSFSWDCGCSAPTAAPGQDRVLPVASTAPGTRVTQLLTARGPPATPASPPPFLKTHLNLQIRKQACFLR